MSLAIKSFYEFGPFVLDPEERVLLRDGEPVQMTPKVFDTLLLLIQNQGRTVSKEEMLDTLWRDSFVEESNLTFNIRKLRQALGDERSSPTYIETVPKRGYRFKFEVREILQEISIAPAPEIRLRDAAAEHEAKINSEIFLNALNASKMEALYTPPPLQTIDEKVSEQPPFSTSSVSFKNNRLPFFAACFFLLIVVAGFVFWIHRNYWSRQTAKSEHGAPILSAPFKSEKLTNTGTVTLAVISPDGKFMAYSNMVNDKHTLWLRNLTTGENLPIVPASAEIYLGLAFSHSGNWIYFVRKPYDIHTPNTLYRVSTFGGIPVKIKDFLEGWFSISRDDRQISFARCPYKDDNYCSLMIADSNDGANEQTLVTRQRPIRIGDSQFSPDGKSIAFASGQSRNGSNDFNLFEINIEKRTERTLTDKKFFNIKQLKWLPDGSGVLLAATENMARNYKIFQVSVDTGTVQVLTKDSGSYDSISLNHSADKMISTQYASDFHLYLSQPDNPKYPRLLATARGGLGFAPDGRIIYTSTAEGNSNIWISNLEATDQRQLTSDPGYDFVPQISPDGRYIFFTSNRSGSNQIWRMNIDGSNQMPVTKLEGGYPIYITTDGKWIFYQSALNSNLWKVSTENGTEILVNEKRIGGESAMDSEGKRLAYFNQTENRRYEIVVISVEDQKIIRTFALADDELSPGRLVWSKDGESLFYIMTKVSRGMIWQQSLKAEKPTLFADLGNEELTDFAFTPDGKSFAFIRGNWTHDAFLIEGLK